MHCSSGASWNFLWKLGILSTLFTLVITFLWRNLRSIYLLIICLPRDAKFAYKGIRIGLDLLYCQVFNITVAQLLDKTTENDPHRVLIYFENEEWTAQQIQKLSHKVANYFLNQGVMKGDVIGLFMENRPEYVPIWIGLSRIGCRTALINTSLRHQSLGHCIKTANCGVVIYNSELGSALEEATNSQGLNAVSLYHLGEQPNIRCPSKDLKAVLDNESKRQSPTDFQTNFNDPMLYIFTSGTTGLPKAAVIKNSRFLFGTICVYHYAGFAKSDRIYTSLPMYHISGTCTTSGFTTIFGVPVILRRKFSAANYWKDCIKYRATVGHYIGELCRYVLAQPSSPEERLHNVRLMFGNGVRPDVWEGFQERFGIKEFREFYGSTEGNCNMVNFTGKVGAIGFIPHYLQWALPYKVVKIDEATGNPVRDPLTGRVVLCKEEEVGELVAKINKNHPVRDFEGYVDKTASESKILKDAFGKGDEWFRSGDMLSKDEYGFFYFKDRKGDTFRWKGENCSTTEIQAVISSLCGMQDVVMFGVNVPGAEGKAGMAVICDLQGTLDLPSLVKQMDKVLPKYAQPLFIRVSGSVHITGTFKLQKMEYEKLGYNPTLTTDKIYFLKDRDYIPIDNKLYETILQGKLRV